MAAHPKSKLEPAFAARMGQEELNLRTATASAMIQMPGADIQGTLDRMIDDMKAARYFTDAFLQAVPNKELEALLRVQLAYLEVAPKWMEAVSQGGRGVLSQEQVTAATRSAMQDFEPVMAQMKRTAMQYPSPLVQYQHAGMLGEYSTLKLIALSIETQQQLEPQGFQDALADLKEGLGILLFLYEQDPNYSPLMMARFYIVGWEGLIDQMGASSYGAYLAPLELEWARRTLAFDKSAADGKIAVADALYYQWLHSDAGGAQQQAVATEAIQGLAELKAAGIWNDALATQESNLLASQTPVAPETPVTP